MFSNEKFVLEIFCTKFFSSQSSIAISLISNLHNYFITDHHTDCLPTYIYHSPFVWGKIWYLTNKRGREIKTRLISIMSNSNKFFLLVEENFVQNFLVKIIFLSKIMFCPKKNLVKTFFGQ